MYKYIFLKKIIEFQIGTHKRKKIRYFSFKFKCSFLNKVCLIYIIKNTTDD